MRSLLVVECDAPKLQHDGITIARRIVGVVRESSAATHVEHLRIHKATDITDTEKRWRELCLRFDVVVVVGHSDLNAITMAHDSPPVEWVGLGEFLSPLKPETIVLVGCRVAGILAARGLFGSIRTLNVMYGSWVTTTQAEMEGIPLLVRYVLGGGTFGNDGWAIVQTLYAVATKGGFVSRWFRTDAFNHIDEQLLKQCGVEVLRDLMKRLL